MNDRNSKLKELFGEMSDISDDESQPPRDRPPTPGKDIVFVPRVGTVVQRGDRETARRIAAIATPPPPPPAKRRREGPSSPPPPVTLPEPACPATITDTDVAVPVSIGRPDREMPPPGHGGCSASWRSNLQPVHPPAGLSCPRDGRWISRSSRYTGTASTSFGSPGTAG